MYLEHDVNTSSQIAYMLKSKSGKPRYDGPESQLLTSKPAMDLLYKAFGVEETPAHRDRTLWYIAQSDELGIRFIRSIDSASDGQTVTRLHLESFKEY